MEREDSRFLISELKCGTVEIRTGWDGVIADAQTKEQHKALRSKCCVSARGASLGSQDRSVGKEWVL
jgi:hypothetical protein